ncbi:MAG: exodeoxyribonuclease VII large subunit [Fusobacteria bacterium]|nr:exodeoxyribonuclease VII large subunit [Fusobacteriota bacterium]
MELGVIGVEQFNQMIKLYLETQPMLMNLKITGEISEIKYYTTSGHLYFTLKERESSISCAAFRYIYKSIPRDLKAGDKVEITASANFFEKTGRFQLTVESIKKEQDLGAKFLQLEEIKRRLHAKGYFDESRKKMLPRLPSKIGIITSEFGAALQDFLNMARKRSTHVEIYLYAAQVQGLEVEKDVIAGLDYFYKNPVDVIVITRGGGSIEDLWGFNSEKIALKMCESKIPIVSAIGHEVDTVLIDYIADVRAATPTQAAESVVPDYETIISELEHLKSRVTSVVEKRVSVEKERVKHLKNNYFLKKIKEVFICREREKIHELELLLKKTMKDMLMFSKEKLIKNREILKALSHEAVLKRGFTMTLTNGEILRENMAKEGMKLITKGHEFEIESVIISKK